MRGKESGITAFELTVTLAIMAVIAALTMPPYLKWLRTSRLQSATTNLTTDLELANVLAIRENAMVVVEFETDSYRIFVDNGQGGGHPVTGIATEPRTLLSFGICRPGCKSIQTT